MDSPTYLCNGKEAVRATVLAELSGDGEPDEEEKFEEELPEPEIELDPRSAAQLIIDLVMAHEPGEITLVPTGALTNIALAARLEPRIVPRVREVVLMGGGVHVGNWNATSEFNIVIDPEAAHIVFNEDWPLTMVGLDVTHQALATDAVRDAITELDTVPGRFTLELLDFFPPTLYLKVLEETVRR